MEIAVLDLIVEMLGHNWRGSRKYGDDQSDSSKEFQILS